jgi:protein-tyrosine-phosphatase
MERDTDISPHQARLVTKELLDDYDLVLAMGPHHVERIEAVGGRGKTFRLSQYASHGATERPIGDPFGGELALYRETYDELDAEIRRVLDRIEAERNPGVS